MGEIADAMLDGTLCEGCGAYIGDETGFPGYCSPQCAADRGADCSASDRYEPRVPRFNPHKVRSAKKQRPGDAIRQGDRMACPFCAAKPKVTGFGDHMLTQHRDKWPAAANLI